MKLLKLMLVGVFLSSTPFIVTACDDESSLEEGAEEISDEIDDNTTE